MPLLNRMSPSNPTVGLWVLRRRRRSIVAAFVTLIATFVVPMTALGVTSDDTPLAKHELASFEARFIQAYTDRLPHGFPNRITDVRLLKAHLDSRVDRPADWVLTVSFAVSDAVGRKVYRGTLYADRESGTWYFTEPVIDGCIEGCTSYGVGFPP